MRSVRKLLTQPTSVLEVCKFVIVYGGIWFLSLVI